MQATAPARMHPRRAPTCTSVRGVHGVAWAWLVCHRSRIGTKSIPNVILFLSALSPRPKSNPTVIPSSSGGQHAPGGADPIPLPLRSLSLPALVSMPKKLGILSECITGRRPAPPPIAHRAPTSSPSRRPRSHTSQPRSSSLRASPRQKRLWRRHTRGSTAPVGTIVSLYLSSPRMEKEELGWRQKRMEERTREDQQLEAVTRPVLRFWGPGAKLKLGAPYII